MNESVRSTLRRQAGVISYRQALGLGLTERQIHRLCLNGEWRRVHPGVYRHAVVPPTPEADLRAAGLWLGPEAIATGLGAAWWWGLTSETPHRWELTSTSSAHIEPLTRVRACRTFVDPTDRTTYRDLGVISKPLAVLRGAIALERLQSGRGVALIDRAKQRGMTSDAELDRAFRRNRGTWGTVAMRAILEHVGGRAASELERRAVRILRAAGITGFRVNFRTTLSSGRPVEFDIAFPLLKLALELDGFAFHSSVEQLQADHRRQREVMDDGWRVRRFTWTDVADDPEGFVRAVLALLP